MELTLDQALQKGVEAHKAGKVQEADRYYTAILKAQPKHPDANHNMGVLAVGVGKVEAALPFFKSALNANPSIAQYWLSYMDALIKLDRMVDAKAVLEQAKNNGAKGDGFDQIELRLNTSSVNVKNEIQEDIPTQPNILDELKLDQALKFAKKKLKDGLVEEAKKIYIDILEKFPNNKNASDGIKKLASETLANKLNTEDPPNEKLQKLIDLYNNGQMQAAITEALKLISEFPKSGTLFNILGAAYKGMGRLEEALAAHKKAILLKPDSAAAYNNIGLVLQNLDKLDEALDAYKKALSLKSDFAEAYNNMGNTLKSQGALDQALKAYEKALDIIPEQAETHNNIGTIFLKHGKVEEAIKAFEKALSIKPFYGSAKHMLSALTGNKHETAPRQYVENLFDGYAHKFESSLVGKLEYKMPKLITNILKKYNFSGSLGSVLDLGCGTGLLGPEIKNHCSKLEGIDLSNPMLAVAKQKNVYDKLSQFDIVEYLSIMPLDFDYYIALDVFIYVGHLSDIFRLISSRNKKPGKLVFSTEHTEIDGYHILKSGRYSHSREYIETLCKKFGYKISHFSTNDLRKEQEHFLTGGIYVLSFKP